MEKAEREKLFAKCHAPEAEAAVLGAILLKPSILSWLRVDETHFVHPLHKMVYVAASELYQDDKPIDEQMLFDRLENVPGGLAAISKLMVFSPAQDNSEYWVEILEEHKRLRTISRMLASGKNKLLDGAAAAEIQDSILAALAEVSTVERESVMTMEEATDAELARLEDQWVGGESPRMPSGIAKIDQETGGFPIGTPTALGAKPGVGKSTLLWNCAKNAAQRGEHVVILSNEDMPTVSARLGIANWSGIERRRLLTNTLTPEEKGRVRDAVEALRDLNSRYHTVRVHGRSMRDICREAVALIRKYGARFVALDYIQNVPNPQNADNRNLGIEENLTLYEAMIAEEQVVGILVGQLKRSSEDRRPTMQDFKDSGSIEQKCKMMLIISDSEDVDNTIEVDVVKNSEGRQGQWFPLRAEKGYGRIY